MPQSYDPKLGVLSAFEGVGTAISDVGKIGLMDSMETRRSKMEQDLKRQLQGEAQEFEVEQAGVESERKIEAATVKHGRDIELEGAKAAAKGKTGKDSDKYELTTATGTPLKYDNVRKAWSNQVGADLETFDPNAAMTFEDYLKQRDIRYRTDAPPAPPQPLDENTYRQRYKEQRPDAPQEEIDAAVQKNRAAGKITGTVAAPVAEPGIMDAMAADVGIDTDTGEFAGGAPQGVLAAPAESVAPVLPAEGVDTKAAAIAGVSAEDANKMVNKKNLQSKLMQHKAADDAPSVKRRSSRQTARKSNQKIQKAVNGVTAALSKGKIEQVSKDRVKLALKNTTFVNGLSEADLQALIDYLEQ